MVGNYQKKKKKKVMLDKKKMDKVAKGEKKTKRK